MTREELHATFVSAFSGGERPAVATAMEVARLERELQTVLPSSHVEFMRSHGPIATPSLLRLIVRNESEHWALWEVYSPAEAVDASKLFWSGGMSNQLVAFATDPGGNLFCFRRLSPGSPRPLDAEAWLFDHDFCEERRVADGFDVWLLSYHELRTPPGEDAT